MVDRLLLPAAIFQEVGVVVVNLRVVRKSLDPRPGHEESDGEYIDQEHWLANIATVNIG